VWPYCLKAIFVQRIYRLGVVAVMAAIANQVGTADVFSNLIPIIRPFLVSDIIEVTEANILESLKPPVTSQSKQTATQLNA